MLPREEMEEEEKEDDDNRITAIHFLQILLEIVTSSTKCHFTAGSLTNKEEKGFAIQSPKCLTPTDSQTGHTAIPLQVLQQHGRDWPLTNWQDTTLQLVHEGRGGL